MCFTTLRQFPSQRGWCLVFKTSDVVVELGNTRDADDYLDHILIDVSCVTDEARLQYGRAGVKPANHIFFCLVFFVLTKNLFGESDGRKACSTSGCRPPRLIGMRVHCSSTSPAKLNAIRSPQQ